MNIQRILTLESVSLAPFEIRGARSGINNARTTGPVYVNGQYIPAYSDITGSGDFVVDSSSVTNFSFGSPYGSLTTDSLKISDGLIADSSDFLITKIDTLNSFQIDDNAGFTGTYPISFNLSNRDYLVEPDINTNTSTGEANFIQGDTDITGIGLGQLEGGDFIKHDGFQEYFRIAEVFDNTSLRLESAYTGDTTSGPYTAKKWIIGQTRIQYAKNNITYDSQAAKWKYDATTGSDVTTSTSFRPLADGITMAFTHALSSAAPDLMDSAVVINKTFARETQYETFQFSLPVIPNPESTMELFINDVKKDRFPEGNQDYVLNYTQSPVYIKPPPPDQRFIANMMFLDGIANIRPSTELTESGQIRITDDQGEDIAGIMPGSESISVDSTAQVPYRDYMLEPNTGTLGVIDTIIDEQIVKYVGVDYSDYIDYGFAVNLNGKKQKILFPRETDDDILFQPYSGRLKPREQDHPGPDDIYEINYMVETTSISDELKKGTEGQTVIQTDVYPIKQTSIFLTKNVVVSEGTTELSAILDEGEDFFVSYLTGRITLTEPLTSTDILKISYTPLSKQVNCLTYENNSWFCTVNDSRLKIRDTRVSAGVTQVTTTELTEFEFTLINVQLDTETITVLRIYNETRDKDYDLTGISTSGNVIKLQKNAVNTSIGLGLTEIVIIDYKFESETTEYPHVVVNYLNLIEERENVYIEGADLTPFINSGAIINLIHPDSAAQHFFTIESASYDNYGTKINLKTKIPEDIVNPKMYMTDSSVSFLTVPLKADSIVAGTTTVLFPGTNIWNIFRKGTILGIKDDSYQVSSAFYDSNLSKTIISLNSETLYDYTDSTDLSNIRYSDCPVYLEGETEIIPEMPAVTLFNQSGFIVKNNADEILRINSDATQLTIDNTSFLYEDSPTLGDMSSAIDSSNISFLSLTTYAPQWKSDKIIPVSDLPVYRDSSTILSVSDALRYTDSSVFVDTTNFSLSEAGTIILDNALERYDRYKLDYIGREFLGDLQVEYSTRYFVPLPIRSKVSASFQYDNLDQFFIQVMDQRDFFDTVTIPRMREEAQQLNGNIGQGGEIIGDEGMSSSDGGLTGDEFRRQDTDIECRVFKNIYDFFHYRIKAFGDEMDAALGLRMFNNDGMFTEEQQIAAFKVINRIFPEPDHTNFEPMEVNPLTSYFFDNGAVFTQNETGIESVGDTYWLKQLKTSDFIGRADSTRRYQIASVESDSSVSLNAAFEERSTISPFGERYTASTNYPIYDDDGNLGAKIVGAKESDFRILSGDAFNCWIDGINKDYTFATPLGSADTISTLLTSGIDGLSCKLERIVDSSKTFGYRSTLVMKTIPPANHLVMGDNTTVTKLGFINDDESYGNLDRTDHEPEIILDAWEAYYFNHYMTPDWTGEISYLDIVIAGGSANKLDRIDTTNLSLINDVYAMVGNEIPIINKEIQKLGIEISATRHIIEESTLEPAYTDTSQAHYYAVGADASAQAASTFANDIYPSWQGKGTDWKWVLDFTENSQFIRGINADGIGVDSTGSGITPIEGQSTFILEAPPGDDRRILNTIDSTDYSPDLVYEDTLTPVDGSWTGWDPSVSNAYSDSSQIAFHLNTLPVFYIKKDVVVAPTYTIDGSNLTLNWTESEGPKSHTFPFSSYPTVSSLVTAIDEKGSFGATAIYSNYDYTNLTTAVSVSVPSFPGTTISSGTASPAFSMYSSDPATKAFSMYSTDSTAPYYETDSSALVIVRTDGTVVTKNQFDYTSYLTLANLETGVDAVTNVHVTGYFEPTYNYSSLDTTSGIMDTLSPGSDLYFSSLPFYEVDTSAVVLLRANGAVLSKNEFLYSSYPTLGNLETGIDAITNISVIGYYDSTYNYSSLASTSGIMAKSSPGTYLHLISAPLFNIFFEMDNLRYITDATALNILWGEGTETVEKIFLYTDASTVLSMKNAINNLTGLDATGDPIYNSHHCGSFQFASGTIPPDATIIPGLADSTVAYNTISDKILTDRSSFVTDRSSFLTWRISYLETRETEIRSHILTEETLRQNTGNNKGDPGDLYTWANNRFNRRQGCYARLKQIEQQIASESVRSSDQQELNISDSTKELVWKRARPDNQMIRNLEELTNMFGHSVLNYAKSVKKKLKHLRKF